MFQYALSVTDMPPSGNYKSVGQTHCTGLPEHSKLLLQELIVHIIFCLVVLILCHSIGCSLSLNYFTHKIKTAGKEQLVSEVFMFGWFGVDLGIDIN